MTFRRFLGLTSLLLASTIFVQSAVAQSEPAPVQVDTLDEPTAAVATELTDAHGTAQPGDAAAGATKAALCAACHSVDGNATDPQYPKLAGQHERYIARQLALYKSGERENAIMLGFSAALSPQDMRDIGAHFAAQKGSSGMADDSKIAAGPNQGLKFYEVGQELYLHGNAERSIPACAACHGPAGSGNPGPAYPHLLGQHATYTSTALKAFRDGAVWGRDDNANAVMMGVAKYLTDEEINSLASYIEGMYPKNLPGTTAAP